MNQSDTNRSKVSEHPTSTSIASLGAQLAQESSNLGEVRIEVQSANKNYLVVVDGLNKATKDIQTAQTSADSVANSTMSARSNLGSITIRAYQENGNPLNPLAPYLTSESLADLADTDVTLTRAREKNNAKVQNVEALEVVATSTRTITGQKVEAEGAVKTSVETAKTDAEVAANEARSIVAITRTNCQSLITQSAVQHNTTVELKTKHQNQAESERKAREEVAAQVTTKTASRKAAADLAQKQAEQVAARPQESVPAPQEQASRPSPGQQSPAQEPATTPQSEPETTEEETVPAPAPAPVQEPALTPVHSGSAASTTINTATGYLGTSYVWVGESATGLDYSGLAMVSYAVAGVELAYSSRVQCGEGSLVLLDAAQLGDLIFWSSDGGQSGAYHVATYPDDDMMIETPTFGMTACVTSMRYSGTIPHATYL